MKTPLYNEHVKMNARIVDFAGWELPVQYSSIIEEHNTVRTMAGIFDVSHLGDVYVKGKDAKRFLLRVLTNDVTRLKDLSGQYTLIPNKHGGTVDDITIYRINDECFFLVINAANIEKDYQWLVQNITDEEVEIMNVSRDIATIALQGPLSSEILKTLLDDDIPAYRFFNFIERDYKDNHLKIAYSGYTGEEGFEIFCNRDASPSIWNDLLNIGNPFGMKPCGLGARDTLRLEASLNLYGHELTDNISAIEADVAWAVKFNHDFIAKNILQKQMNNNVDKSLTCMVLDDRLIARAGMEIFLDGRKIGWVSSGTFSPTLKKNIAIGFIPPEYKKIGGTLEISIREKMKSATIVTRPFYKRKK